MTTRLLLRAAAVTVGGALALAPATAALADDHQPGEIPLNGDHREETAGSGNWPEKCSADEFDGREIPGGFDGWHFRMAGPAEFDTLYLDFEDTAGDPVTITIDASGAGDGDGTSYTGWIRTSPSGHAYLYTPAGWTLLDGSADTTGRATFFNVSHACPDGSGGDPTTSPPTTTPPTTTPPTTTPPTTTPPTTTPTGSPSPTVLTPTGDDSGLPATGMQVGGLVALGVVLAAGGAALLLVRRRSRPVELLDD